MALTLSHDAAKVKLKTTERAAWLDLDCYEKGECINDCDTPDERIAVSAKLTVSHNAQLIGEGKKPHPAYCRRVRKYIAENYPTSEPDPCSEALDEAADLGFFAYSPDSDGAEVDIRYRVEPFIVDGSCTIVSGDPGSYKTWFVYDVCRTGSEGGLLFGGFKVAACPTMLIQLEGPEQEHRRRLRLLHEASGNGGDHRESALFDLYEPDFNLRDPKNVERLCAAVRAIRPGILGIDNVSACFGGDSNSPEWASDVRTVLAEVRNAHPVSIILVHHPRKLARETALNDPSQRLAGNADLSRLIDHHLHLQIIGKDTVTLSVEKMRIGMEPPSINLKFHGPEEGAGAYFENLGAAADPTASAGTTKRILELLTASPGGSAYTKQIVDRLQATDSEDQVRRGIKTLTVSRKIEKGKRDRNGTPVALRSNEGVILSD